MSMILIFFLSVVATFLFCGFPLLGAAVTIILSVFEVWNWDLFGRTYAVSDIALVLFLIAAIVRQLISKDRINPIGIAFIAIAVFAFLSSIFCLNQRSAVLSTFRLSCNLALAYFIALYLSKTKRVDWGLRFFNLSVIVILVIIIWKYLTYESSPDILLKAGFYNLDTLVMFLAVIIPFILREFRCSRRNEERAFWIVIFYLSTVLALIANSSLGTPIFILAILCMLFTGLLKKNDCKWLLPVIIILFLFCWQNDWLSSISAEFSRSYEIWKSGLRLQERVQSGLLSLLVFAKHPLLGAGPGQIEAYLQWSHPGLETNISGIGSSLLIILAEWGLPGCSIYVGIFMYILLNVKKAYAKDSATKNGDEWFYKALLISIGILILSILIYPIHSHRFSWCLIGYFLGVVMFQTQQKEDKERF